MPPEVPQDLSKIIARRLHKNPDRRFQHADDSKIVRADAARATPRHAVHAGTVFQALREDEQE
jgi:hypothetical protein